MRLRPVKSLREWTEEVGGRFVEGGPTYLDKDILRPNTRQSLIRYGFTSTAIETIMAGYSNEVEIGVGIVQEFYMLVWVWPNGEEIILPINRKGGLYIGNMPVYWLDMYPFLKRVSESSRRVFECSLAISKCETEESELGLYIGGQSHFGHFALDTFAPLVDVIGLASNFSWRQVLCSKKHKGTTLEMLDILLGLAKENKREAVGSVFRYGGSQIYRRGPTIVPAYNHNPLCLLNAQDFINRLFMKKHSGTEDGSRNIAYISRMPIGIPRHDRIERYDKFCSLMKGFGAQHIYPNNMSLEERYQTISKYDYVITDSGSCELNAFLFTKPSAKILSIKSRRVLAQASEIELAPFYKHVPLMGKSLFSLIGEPVYQSTGSAWYDKINITNESLKRSLEACSYQRI